MDYILKNTYTNIPTCISDALKELYINQKKLQEESKGVVSQTKNLLNSYEKDVNSLRNEVNIGSMNFQLYCQTTTEKLESIKNNLSNEVHINNIKNDEWRTNIQKKILQDTIGWTDGANRLQCYLSFLKQIFLSKIDITDMVKQVESFQTEFRVFREKINDQKVDISSFKDCLLENCKRNGDLIKELTKYLKIDEIKKENEKLKMQIESMQSRDETNNKQMKEIEQNLQRSIESQLKSIEQNSQKLDKYIKDNDNYVSNLYKHIFDVNKDYRSIKDDIDEKKRSIQFSSIEVNKEFTLNPQKPNELRNSDKSSSSQSSNRNLDQTPNRNIKYVNDNQTKYLDEKIQRLYDEIDNLKHNEIFEDQFLTFKEDIEQKQAVFLDQIREDIKQSLQVHIQNIQETYFIPLMNRKHQILQKNQNLIDDEDEQKSNEGQNKRYQILKRNQNLIDDDELKLETKNSIRNATENTNIQNREDTFNTIKSQPQEEEDDDDEEFIEEISKNNNNNNNNNSSIRSVSKINEVVPSILSIDPKLEGKQSRKPSSKNSSHASSKRDMIHKDMIDFVDIYKVKNISPEVSPLKAKYSNNQSNKGGFSVSSKGEQPKNNVTVASFKKRQSGDNYSQYIQNSQESQENFQQNLSLYTEEEENLLNQICNNNNKNHLHFSKRKSLQPQQIYKNTPKMNQQGGSTILNKTLPDLSFDHTTSPSKKWPPLDNAGIHQKIQNINMKNMNSTNYTVSSHAKQNKMSVLNLSLDFVNPQNQQNSQQSMLSQGQVAGPTGGGGGSYSSQLQVTHQPVLQLCNYGNKGSVIRAQKFLITSNNQSNPSNSQRPFSQQSQRNSAGGIFNNKSSNKISSGGNRPRSSQENIQVIGQKK